ncbi:serine/threonine-protein phosphatase 6 regulatory ankyrin repeat subunit A-like isoform X2 [Lineus longissimus]|uniref:serine/threonine-protein phosphatase 6 regulatory ankyrin repeat subunit A-like isoform X2 n=1 Tax=Lineus longissimus TaxID=88925 RepID=UPI002B4FB5EA
MAQEQILNYRKTGIFKAIERGDLVKVELLLDGIPVDQVQQLLTSRYETTLLLRRPSNAREYYVKLPTPLIMATAEWYTEILEYLASYKFGLDQCADVEDMSNSPTVYADVPALCLAAMTGKLKMVQSLVSHGATVNQQTSIGDTALFESCFEGHLSIAQYLIQSGASIELANKKKITPLMIASYANNFSIVKMLVNLGANVNKRDEKGRNAGFYCVPAGNLSTFQFLVENGASVQPDASGMTVLMEAAHHGHFEMVKYFVENSEKLGLDVNAFDAKGRNTLFYCAEGGRDDIFQFLVTRATTIRPADDGSTILMVSALKGHHQMVQYLLDNTENLGIDINRKDNKGRNCLFYCVSGGNIDIFDNILRHDALVVASDDGVTLLIQAAGKSEVAFGQHLLDRAENIGLDVHAKDKDGWNALFYCIASGNMELFTQIMHKGVKPSIALDGRNLVMQAVVKGDMEIIRHVLVCAPKFDIDLNEVDDEGRNALFYCIPGEEFEVLNFLLENGLSPILANDNTTLLMHAAEKGKTNFCSYLLAHAQELELHVDQMDSEGRNACFYAAKGGYVSTLDMLLSRGATVNSSVQGRSLLIEAASRGHVKVIDYLLEHHREIFLDINQKDADGKTAALHCLEGGYLEAFKLLHQKGCTVSADKNGVTALMIAASQDEDSSLRFILNNIAELKIDIDAVDSNGENALNYAKKAKNTKAIVGLLTAGISLLVSSGGYNILLDCMKLKDYDVMNCLLASGIDLTEPVNSRDSFGLNSLHYCLDMENLKLLETLGKYYDPYADADNEGVTLLMKACRQTNLDIIKYIVEDLYVDVHCKDNTGRNALMHSVEASQITNMKYLLAFGAIFENDNSGRTPIMAAVQADDTAVLTHLLKYNFRKRDAIVDKDKNGKNAVHYCAKSKSEETFKLLIKYKCHLDAEDHSGETALMGASRNANLVIVRLLIQNGAFPNAKNKRNRNSLHYCFENEAPTLPVVKLLVESGCDPNQRDETGSTPLMLAVKHDNLRPIKYLLENGADPTMQNNEGRDVMALCPPERHVIKVLLGKYTAMDKRHQAILDRHLDTMKSEVKANLLLPYLIDQGIVSAQALTELEREEVETTKMDRLVSMLTKKGPRAFDVLCSALKNNYETLAYELMTESQGGDEFYV